MPSNVTFDDDVITTDDIVNALDKPMVEEDIPDTEVTIYNNITISTDGLRRSTNDDKEMEKRQRAARRGRRQSIAAQIFNPWGQEYRKRISLHGKAIYFTAPSKRKSRHRQIKFAVYNFLERPNTQPLSLLYHLITFALVFGCLVLSVLATIPEHSEFANRVLFWLEIFILILFSIELGLRLWSAGCRCRYQGFFGILRFCRKPFCLIDIVVIFSSFVVICAGSQGNVFATTAMRSLRFLQILRMVRMDRRGGTWKLLSSVVMAHSKELLTAWYIGFLTLIFASFLVYQAEKDVNSKQFHTYADALWWGLITLTTIGYGDKVPKTWVGRLIACCFTILGISFFALPAGILGSGFALKVQEQHRQKHFARRRMPAAYLIQCMWRCYAADKNSRSVATWLPHLRARLNKKKIKDSFRNNPSPKFSRKATFRHRFSGKSSVSTGNITMNGGTSPTNTICPEVSKSHSLAERLSDRLGRQNSVLRLSRKERSCMEKKIVENPDTTQQTDEYDDYNSSASSNSDTSDAVLTEQHKSAVRSIRMMKFLVAKRKFKEALRPYDVKDVIEQYSSGHVEMLARIKNLQNRVDMILGINSDTTMGNPPSYYYRSIRTSNDHHHCHNSNSMNSRLAKVESDVENVDKKLELILHILGKTSPSPLNKRRERRMNWKKEPPKSEFLAAQMVFEPLSDGDGEHTESTKRQNVTGFEEEQIQGSSPPNTWKQKQTKTQLKNEEKMEFLPASAWESPAQEKKSLQSPDFYAQSSFSSNCVIKDEGQTNDVSKCESASLDSVQFPVKPTLENPRNAFSWQNAASTYDNVHHSDAIQTKSLSSVESYSFTGVEELSPSITKHREQTLQTSPTKEQAETYQPSAYNVSWTNETSVTDKLSSRSSSEPTSEIQLNDNDSDVASSLNIKPRYCFDVPCSLKASSKSLEKLSMENEESDLISTSRKESNSSLCNENNANVLRHDHFNPTNKFIPSFPTSCAELSEENIALTRMKSTSKENRYSLPLASIADFSSSSDVV